MIQKLTKPAHAAVLREQARRLEQEAAALLRLANEIENEGDERRSSTRAWANRP